METVPYFVAALLYILGGYAFNLMVKCAVGLDEDDSKTLNPRMIRFLTVVWPFVMIAVMFRPSKKKTA